MPKSISTKTLLYGIFCYFASMFFFVVGAGMTAYFLDMFFYAENGVMIASILLPFSIIFMIMGVAVFKLGGRVLNPPKEPEDNEDTEI